MIFFLLLSCQEAKEDSAGSPSQEPSAEPSSVGDTGVEDTGFVDTVLLMSEIGNTFKLPDQGPDDVEHHAKATPQRVFNCGSKLAVVVDLPLMLLLAIHKPLFTKLKRGRGENALPRAPCDVV